MLSAAECSSGLDTEQTTLVTATGVDKNEVQVHVTKSVENDARSFTLTSPANEVYTTSRMKVVEVVRGFIVDNNEDGFRDMARSPLFEQILRRIETEARVSRKPDLTVPRSLRYEGD